MKKAINALSKDRILQIILMASFIFVSFQEAIAGLPSKECTDILSELNLESLRVYPSTRSVFKDYDRESTPHDTGLKIGIDEFEKEIEARIERVPEFKFIRDQAEKMGLRVYLFGGTAAGFAHYVKWDILREAGDKRFQGDRFDYDYTNIYRSTQDLDIVVDGSAQDAQALQAALKTRFPYFLGSKGAGWEVRSLKEPHGDKGGLLGDFGFMNQHTDSNSTGMVELTIPKSGESVVRDIRDWSNVKDPVFLKDAYEGKLTFYPSSKHSETPRAKSGQNPPIFSVIRVLTKAFQYDLKIRNEDLAEIRKEIDQFDPKKDLMNPDAARWIEKNGRKLFQHAVDLESAWNMLENLGLRQKLISIQNNSQTVDSLSWWMNKEPLRSKPVGEGEGRTAESLGLKIVAHATKDFQAYESITRSHMGTPNVFVSRQSAAGSGESAVGGDGFYTAVGKIGSKAGGITIHFEVNPKAREGSDFVLDHRGAYEGAHIIWRNKNALKVIPESLNMSLPEYFEFLADGNKLIGQEDQALLWKLKRKLDHSVTSGRIPESDINKIRSIVFAQIKNNTSQRDVTIHEWLKIEKGSLKKDPKEVELLLEGLDTKSYRADLAPLFDWLVDLSRGTSFESYVAQEWLPSILKHLTPDIGDRALENSLFSNDPQIRKFGLRALAMRESTNPNAFLSALKSIRAQGVDAKTWLKSETRTTEQVHEKAAYLALHPELRNILSEVEFQLIEPAFEKLSNLPVFERLAGGRLPPEIANETKSESFEFIPLHTKLLEMQTTKVTQLQWSLVMGQNPSNFHSNGAKIKINGREVVMHPNRPVETVSWDGVQKFIERLNSIDPKYNYRLPTRAEWEYEAWSKLNSAISDERDVETLGDYNWNKANSGNRTHDVASLKPSANGLYDMDGNVSDWVQDGQDTSWPRDPTRFGDSWDVAVGGSWYEEPQGALSDRAKFQRPTTGSAAIGFRLVRMRK